MKVALPNLRVLCQFQKRLDDWLIKERGIRFPVTELKILAFKVEFSEFLNETQFFKYWKMEQTPKEGMTEEFVDGIHFLLGIANDRKWDKFIHALDSLDEWEEATLLELSKDIYENPLQTASDWLICVNNYLQMAAMLGITVEDIEKEYLKKNKKNLDRWENGY